MGAPLPGCSHQQLSDMQPTALLPDQVALDEASHLPVGDNIEEAITGQQQVVLGASQLPGG